MYRGNEVCVWRLRNLQALVRKKAALVYPSRAFYKICLYISYYLFLFFFFPSWNYLAVRRSHWRVFIKQWGGEWHEIYVVKRSLWQPWWRWIEMEWNRRLRDQLEAVSVLSKALWMKAVAVDTDEQGEIRAKWKNRIWKTELLVRCEGKEELEVKCTLILAGLW